MTGVSELARRRQRLFAEGESSASRRRRGPGAAIVSVRARRRHTASVNMTDSHTAHATLSVRERPTSRNIQGIRAIIATLR